METSYIVYSQHVLYPKVVTISGLLECKWI